MQIIAQQKAAYEASQREGGGGQQESDGQPKGSGSTGQRWLPTQPLHPEQQQMLKSEIEQRQFATLQGYQPQAAEEQQMLKSEIERRPFAPPQTEEQHMLANQPLPGGQFPNRTDQEQMSLPFENQPHHHQMDLPPHYQPQQQQQGVSLDQELLRPADPQTNEEQMADSWEHQLMGQQPAGECKDDLSAPAETACQTDAEMSRPDETEPVVKEEEILEEKRPAAAAAPPPYPLCRAQLPGMIPLSGLMNLGNAAQIAKTATAEAPLAASRNSSRYFTVTIALSSGRIRISNTDIATFCWGFATLLAVLSVIVVEAGDCVWLIVTEIGGSGPFLLYPESFTVTQSELKVLTVHCSMYLHAGFYIFSTHLNQIQCSEY